MVRENNGFFGRLNNLDANSRSSRSARSEVQGQTPILSSNELLDQILPLEDKFISRDVNLEYLWYQAQSPGGVDLPLLSGIEEYDGRFYPLEPFLGLPSTLGPDNGFASPNEAQTFIDNFSQQRDPEEQQLLNLYHEIGQSLKDELQGPTNTQIGYEDWLAWENTQIGQFERTELTQTERSHPERCDCYGYRGELQRISLRRLGIRRI